MYPALFTEIAPNLFQGGTDDEDVIHVAADSYRRRNDLPFDAIVTMYAWARPADWQVQEFRYGVPDSTISEINLERLREAVEFGYKHWKSGDRTLIRCQAGLNRSGLVAALILIKDGYSPELAIQTLRSTRGEYALCNERFAEWLITDAVNFLNVSPSQQAA